MTIARTTDGLHRQGERLLQRKSLAEEFDRYMVYWPLGPGSQNPIREDRNNAVAHFEVLLQNRGAVERRKHPAYVVPREHEQSARPMPRLRGTLVATGHDPDKIEEVAYIRLPLIRLIS